MITDFSFCLRFFTWVKKFVPIFRFTMLAGLLASGLSQLEIVDSIYNFIINFFQDRSLVTRFAGLTSVIAYINASTVQGSGFGLSSFDVAAAGLHPLSATTLTSWSQHLPDQQFPQNWLTSPIGLPPTTFASMPINRRSSFSTKE